MEDGSFSLDSSLEWFVSRCSKLESIPQISSLIKKGHNVTEDEVVNAVAELFLHTDYTCPVIGCFRPIARKIVDKAVSLLRLVPNLRSNSEDVFEEVPSEVFHVVEYCDRGGRGLDLHELACLAFCRALDLAPYLLGSVLSYFTFAPPPFERILMKGGDFEARKVGTSLLHAARISYRLLLVDTEVFSKRWNWSCFLELVKRLANDDLCSSADCVKVIVSDTRWCAIHILSIVLKLSNQTTSNLTMGSEEAFTCLLRWDEFRQDVLLEKTGWYAELFGKDEKDSRLTSTDFELKSFQHTLGLCIPMSSSIVDAIEPPMRSQRHAKWAHEVVGDSFVLTSSIRKSYEMVLLALSQKWPVLLYGPPGGGKSSLINKLARDSQNKVLSIHMDDQIDGKTLIGSNVCAEQPGEFRWQPGSLTQAVQNGLWVVFEDIDKAPSDVHSILLPLLESASSFATENGEVWVADSFRLFCTISTSKLDLSRSSEGGSALSLLWRKVMIGPPNNEDLKDIIKSKYPNIEPITDRLIETFERVICTMNQLAGFNSRDSSSYMSRFMIRQLLKWCKRITGLGFSFDRDCLSAYQSQCIYQEAVDIFAAFSTSAENRLILMKDIAKLWSVPASVTETLYSHNKPSIQDSLTDLRVGRVHLQRTQAGITLEGKHKSFVEIRTSLHTLERIACSVMYNEPVLLVGETGTGKTTLVQNLAARLGQKLTVLNLSQQSDVADLLGGFKPIDAQFICFALYEEFINLFSKSLSQKANRDFVIGLQREFSQKNWRKLLNGFRKVASFVQGVPEAGRHGSGKKRKKPVDEEQLKAWETFGVKLEAASRQIESSSGMIFSFVEGAFVTALKNGEWILLDEINLAPPETLQRVVGVLEGENGSLCLAERGDINYICRHPNFRIFACMNPATDAGKRDLPLSLRNRYTEYFVDDVLDDDDLALFIHRFVYDTQSSRELVNRIVCFYKAAKKASEEKLQDGANQKPQYSLRSLYRALEYKRKAERTFNSQGKLKDLSLYDGFSMFFLTLLDPPSSKIMNQMIVSHLLNGKIPPHVPFDSYLTSKVETRSDDPSESYILTKSVREHLRNLARAILIKRYPVLLQGPTSSGKTSLVKYLAAITGHEFVRINNHEHTDLQEYLGTYITDACGNLVFQEGMLVKAVRNGFWIVLDELNLAPSDVLEALNRLLDDNRELFVPELRETIKAHPDFMLFATQNPPTFYGGRKMLSRAFRNRFVEILVEEIPEDELSTIVEKRCGIPESYSKKMVDVMKDLQMHRQSSKVFAGKHGFITPRDLFRWAYRFKEFGCSYEDLARDGYYLLAERLRSESEQSVVQEILERHLRVKLFKHHLYKQEPSGGDYLLKPSDWTTIPRSLPNIVLTKSMQRLCFLVERCYKNLINREPVLLVGETGGGKTTVCQLLSARLNKKLHILNCHQYTETSDFIGGFYPIRERSKLTTKFKNVVERLISKTTTQFHLENPISLDIGRASSTLDSLDKVISSYRQGLVSYPNVSIQDLEHIKKKLSKLNQKWNTIFTWQDGPLVQAMRDGDLFLIDEISLADDSVLERLNSVLEPERKLSLAEKGGSHLETIAAHPEFFLLATMNPGGDYGKKELSPALRNRFTEIWVPPVNDLDELRSIALSRISNPKPNLVDLLLRFWEWFNQQQSGRMLTVRDLNSWVTFMDLTKKSLGPEFAFLHGAFLVLLDGLSLGTGMSHRNAAELREKCFSFLSEKIEVDNTSLSNSKLVRIESYGWGDIRTTEGISSTDNMQCDNTFGIDPFFIEKGHESSQTEKYELFAPTVRRNSLRVLRAMQLPKPVLLEGSPGVGKTSLIVALGKFSGHRVVRINLSEQTDIMDLLGSDLPLESEEGIKFAWSDGILLQALKEGCWVLLDELNLAPQSVLEGLNAILDHRAEVFIPELGVTFKCPSSFRVFACQNPSAQGGGRKGLPKSFLNRFTKVYLDELVEDDYLFICSSLYKSIPRSLLSKLILFNRRLHEETMVYQRFAQEGSPWEFNLRDVFRSCQIIEGAPETLKDNSFLNVLYIQRMRTAGDRREVLRLYEQVFGVLPFINPYPRVQLNSRYLIVGATAIERNDFLSSNVSRSHLKITPGMRQNFEAAAHCVQNQWLCILIGPSCSGKMSLIRSLAQLTGNVLNELNLSSATDISELLGCFQQYNAIRNFHSVVDQVEYHVNKYCNLQFKSSSEGFACEGNDINSKWLVFSSGIGVHSLSSSPSLYLGNWKNVVSSLGSLVEIIDNLMVYFGKDILSTKELDRAKTTILKLQGSDHRPFSAKFEWVVGVLLKALERGEWIVLKNANLCNPTVLDRINSLVEPSGSITINECGTVDGEPVVFHPHRNFRMFLTINPNHGEVSRAMRNRGVEIFMMQPYWVQDEGDASSHEGVELEDVKKFISFFGIPGSKLVESMAKAHLYARNKGAHLNAHITNFELGRWVQLFQQLVMNGNKAIWSLCVSWEHTYRSSLGEEEGMNIIWQAKDAYLFKAGFSESDFSMASLCVPGGWPMPLKLMDFVWYPKESNVKQNCKYLEFLGAQCAAYDFRIASKGSHVSDISAARSHAWMYLMDMKNLSQIMYPKASNAINGPERETDFNLDFACKKLAFAANWTVEQGSESDMDLYILWLSWFNSRLQPFCQFFEFYLISLNQVMKHQVWNHICYLRKKIVALSGFDLELLPVPILSPELVNLTISNDEFTASMDNPEVSKDALKSSCKLLCNAIECIGSLRCSYQQWNMEDMHEFDGEARYFIPVLKSLRILEEEIFLKLHSSFKLAESPFHVLIQLYCNLLDNHISFWNGLTSSKFEQLLVSWNSLMKDVVKFKHFCPESVENFLRESQNLEKVTSFCLRSEKSLLWVHGGHPVLPSSADLYHKQHQLFKLCDTLWPVRTGSWNQSGEVVSNIASSNPELRFLAVEGLSMSSCIVEKCKFDEDDDIIVQNLEDMYQMLLRRFEFEGKKVELAQGSKDDAISEANSSLCCSFSNDFLLRGSRFDIWLDALPLIDSTSFFLDMALLQELSSVYLVKMEGSNKPVVGSVSKHVKTALDFSLRFSSRPPQIFLPHQNILWTFDDRTSVDTVKAKAVSFVVEMWFRWHQSLWNHCLDVVKNFSKVVGSDTQVPYMLLQPVKAATIFHILRSSYAIKDFYVHCSKIKVASCNLWLSPPLGADVPCFLLSAARSLFHQILCAHQKSFDAAQFTEINTILNSVQKEATMEENIQRICSLIKSSNHQRLKNSVHKFIQPLLLYLHYPSRELDSNIGHAWIRLGVLRFHLLLDCGDLDPGTKYQYKYSQLVNKKSDLELEIQVRKECKHLAGSLSMGEVDKKRALAFENIEVQRRGLQRKIIFRLDPGKFKKLKHECNKFLDFVNLLLTNLEAMKLQQIVDQVHNWQETASRFIDRLSDEYAGYIDIVQPVQIAVYEMKLGLSLVMSTVCFPNRVGQHSMQLIKETIYSFMRFPRVHPLNNVAVCSSNGLPGFSFNDISSSAKFCATEVDLLEKLVVLSSETAVDSMVSIKQLKASLHYNLLVRVSHSVADTQLMDGSSFALLDKTFNEFADLWMSFKVKTKTKEEFESQSYKFRPRVFKIEKVLEADVGEAFANDGSPEWKEFLSEKETTEMEDASKELEIAEEDWNLVPEPILNHMIWIHNQLFGSSNLILPPGVFKVSDTDRLSSFSDSYTLGLEMIRVLCAPWLPSLDSKLAPEHSLRLCLEHEEKLVSSRREACRYNFYKDSNAPVMAKMVKLLAPIRQRVSLLLHEQESSYGLQKIWDITEMLLSIPMNSPLAKALSGLQVLFNTCQTLQESGSKYGLSDQLEPIRELVSLWKAMEFDSWPALLDEVQDQYETDAGKLWFPLHSVLQNRSSADISGYNESMIQSLNDLMNTSSIGDFRKRLQLLFAFFGQINTGGCLNLYSSVFDVEKVKVLYNLFGYYVQFLPVILEHRDTKRKEIELELKKLQKLCRWEHLDSHLSIENSRRTRMKLRKIIQKYSDLLQQPVVPFINPNASQKGTHQIQPLHSTFDQGIFDNEDRFLWLSNWREKVHNDLQSMCLQKPSRFDITFLNIGGAEEVVSIIRQLASQPTTSTQYEEEWKAVWYTLGNIYTKAVYCSELWKDSKKSQKKRWALSELLKLLETSGLSKHKSLFAEGQVKSWWFLQPSYDVQHLLLTQSRLSSGTSDMAGLSNVQSLENEGSISEWKRASEYYFKSIASVQFLQHKCLNFHKDVTGEQVERSKSFLNQLIDIQQKQQSAANYFANHLQRLKNSVSMLEKLYSNTSNSDSGIDYEVTVIQNQDAIYKCMWEQKQVLDSLCAMMHEELLLLKTTANTHSNTCQSVRTPANQIFETIDKFLPVFQISKISLDDHLLAQSRAMTTLVTSSHTSIVTKKMKDLLLENFEGINTFREHLSTFFKDFGRTSVEKVLLGHFDEVFEKASLIEKEFKSTLEANEITNTLGGATCSLRNPSKLDTAFNESFRNTIEHIIKALGSFQFISSEHVLPQEFLGKVTSWEFLFRSFTESLGLDSLCDKILKTISCVVKLLNHSDEGLLGNPILETNRNHFQIGAQFKQLNVLLYSMMNFADCLLKEFLAMHCTVSATTSVLATIFTDLYSQGFGTSNEEQVDSANDDKTQDASGTGMAEGIGMNDVSDELLDEDQLIGTDDKPSEEQAGPNEVPSKTDKGIEMEQDFNADTFSVSEDSGEEDEDSGDEQLESTIGEAGTNSEAVDEKLWDKNEDENPTNEKEKYESGPSVKDEDASSRELRAMDDSAPSVNESGEVNPEELDGQQDEIGSDADHGDGEDAEDMELDKDEAFTEPTGLNIEESNQRDEENLDMDDNEAEDTTKEADAGEQEDSVENEHNEEEKGGPLDETMVEADETQKEGEASEMDGQDRNHEDNVQTDLPAPRKDFSQPGTTEFIGGNTPNPESSNQAIGDRQASESKNTAPESNWFNNNENRNDHGISRGLPSGDTSQMDEMATDLSNSGRLNSDQPKTQIPEQESSSLQKAQPNPFRNIGDALKEWKERARVLSDLQADDMEVQEEVEDKDADEYGYVPESVEGTTQAMGLATSEQNEKSVKNNDLNRDSVANNSVDLTEMEIERKNSEANPLRSSASFLKSKMEDPFQLSGIENIPMEESQDDHTLDSTDPRNLTENLVFVMKPHNNEPINQFAKLSVSDEELGKAQDPVEVSNEVRNNATALWRRYELLTTRLSQELAEQLRLVLEPTLASKLQGDYKTGKRINMKKVIPYIASHYRKDKIWLRRTRPNKRDYQVVIAIDDSHSMSESGCGGVATEALVTVCRAMSQLEIGSLAVASFGKKGNIRLLHEFDQQFTGEAGIKMISNLTFKQENSITDEPLLDLLKYLNSMLDTAVSKARLPSGQNPLQQLVLIIADGRMTEKDRLKRYVRDALGRKRMVAFLLLDSQQESIMDLKEATFPGGKTVFTKYLDSFPFPYYIVLRNIEALPSTLADLLRQWFEVMQYSGE